MMKSNEKLNKVVQEILTQLLSTKRNEKVLVVCDRNTEDIAGQIHDKCRKHCNDCSLLKIEIGRVSGEEPSTEVENIMLKYDVLIIITTKSMTHTNARKKCTEQGARIITMPGVTESMLIRCGDIDYEKLWAFNNILARRMRIAGQVRVTTKSGTDIRFRLHNGKVCYDDRLDRKGAYNNIPMGEVFAPPIECSANGVYVADGSHAGIGRLSKPITIRVKDGYAVRISGGAEAHKLRTLLKSVGSRLAYNIAEFGIGTNEHAIVTGNVLEDEKAIGTCHIALGKNSSFGGMVDVPIHLDGIIKAPTIYFDSAIIMQEGSFFIA